MQDSFLENKIKINSKLAWIDNIGECSTEFRNSLLKVSFRNGYTEDRRRTLFSKRTFKRGLTPGV